MATGNIKASKWNIVLNAKKETPNAEISHELEGYLLDIVNHIKPRYYFAIVHDKDKLENGEAKRTHLHLILELAEKGTFKTVLDKLTTACGISEAQVQLDAENSPILGEQYLIHKNDPSKYQYESNKILTNNLEELTKRLEAKYLTEEEREEERKKALYESKTLIEFIDRAGLDYANRFRGVFKEIRKEKEEDFESVLNKLTEIEKRLYNLTNQLRQLSVDITLLKMSPKDIEEKLEFLIDFYNK